MEYQVKRENLLVRLKNTLNGDDVKLWLPPFYEYGKCNFELLLELTMKYYRGLNVDSDSCFELLQDLQNTSLSRLEERRNFKEQGLATLRVRLSSKQVPEFSVQIRLCDIANDLRVMVASKTEIPEKRLKLIAGGRVLVPEERLDTQNVKHGSTILAVVLPSDEEKNNLVESNSNQKLLNESKSDVECLMSGDTNSYLNVTNQLGASLNMPSAEKKALALAMALHEKGKRAFQTGEYSLALVFFLEADTEFKYCHSDILQKVDNYALLNLDIVWTYLHLQSLHHLNDAEERLKLCEQGFLRTYGANMERLQHIKGASGNESVLLVRLRLLQGILCYLTNRQKEAVAKFDEVEGNIQVLKVDNENVKTLCNLGYPASEARIALRATFNDLDAAVVYILQQREEKEAIRKHERLRKFADRHRCLNGDLVNLTVLEQLHNMGYTRLFGVFALRNGNNRLHDALTWIDNFFSPLYTQYPSAAVDELKRLEFSDPDVRPILQYHHYELDDACLLELLSLVNEQATAPGALDANSNTTPCDLSAPVASTSSASTGEPSASAGGPSTAAGEPSTSSGASKPVKSERDREKMRQEHEAWSRLQECISNDADGYLDIDLQSEENFLLHYKSLLPH